MSAEPLEGFWAMPKAFPSTLHHFFIEGSPECLCGKWRLREMSDDHQVRPGGKSDCLKCVDIHRELFAVKPPEPEGPAWTVKSDPVEGTHALLYQGKEQSVVRGDAGGATQRELAAMLNKNGSVPKKKKKVRCAADAPDPAKYVAKHADKSPELPLDAPPARPFTEKDFPELIRYLDSLFDESPLGSVTKPVWCDEVENAFGEFNDDTRTFLMWLGCCSGEEREELEAWLDRTMETDTPVHLGKPVFFRNFEEELERDLNIEKRAHLWCVLTFVILHDSKRSNKPTPKTNTAMPAKAKALTPPPVDFALPPVQEIPANQLHRSDSNRLITKERTEKMSASIRQDGVMSPLTVRWIENAMGVKVLEIVAGEGRWSGCMAIDENYPVPCFIRDLSDKDAARIRAIENFQRQDLDEVEEARSIQNLKDTGWEIDEICDFLGREKSGIYQRLALMKLSGEAHTALREKNITFHTAVKLASLPDEQREEALKAVVSPTYAAKALPERQALELLDREFIEPAKRAKEWEKRRDVILENHPGAKWQAHEIACRMGGWNSGFVRAEAVPTHDLLSDAARSGELVVPTWGELGKKHGAEVLIGCNHSDEAFTYVEPKALIDAEKAACSKNPADCIFIHEDAVAKARADSEKRKIEQEAHRQALAEEEKRLVEMVLSPDGIGKTALKKLVERVAMAVMETEIYLTDYQQIFTLEKIEDEDEEELQKRVDAVVLKYLRSKNFTSLEAMARIQLAAYILSYNCGTVELFETGMAKPADFPAHHKEYLEQKAREEQQAKAGAEAAAAKQKEVA